MEEVNARSVESLQGSEVLRNEVRRLELSSERERNARVALTRNCQEWRSLIDGLVREVGELRDERAWMMGIVARLAERGGVSGRAEGGRLVPIEEPMDRAEDEVIDLTDEGTSTDISRPSSGNWSGNGEVIDLSQEEDDQAEEERRRGILTFHAETVRAQADPSPEYRPHGEGSLPPYE